MTLLLPTLLVLMVLAATSATADNYNVVNVHLPKFSMSLIGSRETDIDLNALEDQLTTVTRAHLYASFGRSLFALLNEESNSDTKESIVMNNMTIHANIHGMSTGERQTLSSVSDDIWIIYSDFTGEVSFRDTNSTEKYVSEDLVRTMTASAFTDDDYWLLLYRFSDDHILKSIADVEVIFELGNPVAAKSTSSDSKMVGVRGFSIGRICGILFVGVLICVGSMLLYLYLRKENDSADKIELSVISTDTDHVGELDNLEDGDGSLKGTVSALAQDAQLSKRVLRAKTSLSSLQRNRIRRRIAQENSLPRIVEEFNNEESVDSPEQALSSFVRTTSTTSIIWKGRPATTVEKNEPRSEQQASITRIEM